MYPYQSAPRHLRRMCSCSIAVSLSMPGATLTALLIPRCYHHEHHSL